MANQSNTFQGASVFGGFNMQGNQFHGNVNIGGLCRDDTDDLQCLRLLKIVNPEDERRRILTVKDQLVTASYSWILEDETFRSWLDEATNHLLWIKGGPGKGKTMMMAGLVDVLSKARNSEGAVAISYFFCQNSESELRKVTSIVKGLIYMLAFRERSLVHHLKETYEAGGEEVFTGPRALSTLWGVLEVMLRDFHGERVYLIVDGLDECDDPELDDFLYLLSGCSSTTPGKIKWLVTSRPLPRIEDIIGPDQDRYRISLEIEAQHVSQGVETFIDEKVNLLRLKKSWSEETTQTVRSYLQKNAEGTFLWVALVCQRLRRSPLWKVKDELTKLTSLQRGLDSFYERMMQVVRDEIPEYADLCMNILRTMTLAYRPLRLRELGTVVALPHELQSDDSPNFDALRDLIERCGSFILVHEDTIYFVHQSAKDYLSGKSGSTNFLLDRLQEHSSIAEKCLDTLNSCLKDHQFPDPASLSRQKLSKDESQLLSRIAYACSYWTHHTLESVSRTIHVGNIPNEGRICDLFNYHFIAWVHALASLKEVTACVRIIKSLLDIQGFKSKDLFHMLQDMYRFLRQSRHIIEESPNQTYTSALLFVPKSSLIRKNYHNHIPKWIKLTTRLNETWDACLETLLGHSTAVTSLTFSSDGSLLASRSRDCARVWETETGKCQGVISHKGPYLARYRGYLAFSSDDRVLVSRSHNGLELLDITTGSQKHLPIGSESWLRCNSHILASVEKHSVRLWNIFTGASCGVFELHGNLHRDIDFSHDSKRIVIASGRDVEIRNLDTLNIVATFPKQHGSVDSVQFSPDSRVVLCVTFDSIWLWTGATTKPGKQLQSHFDEVDFAIFSPDGNFILSTHEQGSSLILWETSTGNRLHVFTFQSPGVRGSMFSPDSRTLVTPLSEGAISWDTATGKEIATLEVTEDGYVDPADISICSKDGSLFAQSKDSKTRIWEVATGTLLDTLVGHSTSILDLEFSPVGGLIASASGDNTVKLWSLNQYTSSQATVYDGFVATRSITISLDETLAISASPYEEIRLWDLESGLSRTLPDTPHYHKDKLVISPDNCLLAMHTGFGVWIRETEDGSLRYESTNSGHNHITRIAFSPDSRLLKAEFNNGTIQLVENYRGAFEDVQKPPPAESTQSQNSPDGRFFVDLDSSLRTVCLWEQSEDTDQAIFRFELGRAGGVATFSQDSKLIAFVSTESFISVWETEMASCHDISLNFICCNSVVSFSHDNRFITYTSGHENTLGILELSTGIPWALEFVCADPVKLVTFSPDCSMVAAVSGSTTALWETTSGSLARKLEYDDERVNDITFLPDRNILITGHEDGTILSWDTNHYVLLHTFHTKDRPPRFSLDCKRGFLWTGNQGFFLNEVLSSSEESAISLKDNWVLFNGERVFWIPTEFRPDSSESWAASGKCLVFGHPSGDLTVVNFNI